MPAPSHIRFQSGPYRRWSLSLRQSTHVGGPILVDLQAPTPVGQPELRAAERIREGHDGYELLSQAAADRSTQSMQRALAWLLDAAAAILATRADGLPAALRQRWAAIVQQGSVAQDEHTARSSDGPEAHLDVIDLALVG